MSAVPALLDYEDYHPCSSRLMVADTAGSINRDLIVLPMTWGTGVGTNKVDDRDLVARIVAEPDVLTVVATRQQFRSELDQTTRFVESLAQRADVVVQLDDHSGFGITPVMIGSGMGKLFSAPGLDTVRTTEEARAIRTDIETAITTGGPVPHVQALCVPKPHKFEMTMDFGPAVHAVKGRLVVPATVRISGRH